MNVMFLICTINYWLVLEPRNIPYEVEMDENTIIKLVLKYLEGEEASFKHKEFVYALVLND